MYGDNLDENDSFNNAKLVLHGYHTQFGMRAILTKITLTHINTFMEEILDMNNEMHGYKICMGTKLTKMPILKDGNNLFYLQRSQH